MDCDGLNH